MASRSRAATLSARPSTSSGPGTNSFENFNFDKRVSRDDLSLVLKSASKGNVKVHHIPVRGRLPSPETSPHGASLARVTTLRTTTPESLAEGDPGLVAIGMALGSPSQAPDYVAPAWESSHNMSASFPLPEPVEETEAKPKTPRKWGIFGRAKSKKARPGTRPQRAMTEVAHSTTTSISSGTDSMSRDGVPVDLDKKKVHKYKPIMIRSQTEPMVADVPSKEAKPTKELRPKTSTKSMRVDPSAPKTKKSEKQQQQQQQPPPPHSPVPPMPSFVPPSSGPLLDVEIPTIKMDRYSVMFGDVLQSQQPASSLLARRQATLDRLKTINDEMNHEKGEDQPLPRRATSPTATPTFSLFPSTPGAARSSLQLSQRPSPRLRSNTSPAMLHSPNKATFEVPKKRQDSPKAKVVQAGGKREPKREPAPAPVPQAQVQLISRFSRKTSLEPGKGVSSSPKKPSPPKKQSLSHLEPSTWKNSSPSMQPSPFTPDTSSLILSSPDNSDDESEVHITNKLKPTFKEPAWEMITPPASTTSSSPKAQRKPSPPSSLTPPEQINNVKPAEDDAQEALNKAVAISIARQISVSHQQRRMLRPLQNQPPRRRKDGSPADPLKSIAVGENERLVETKTATPTLVHPEDTTDSSGILLPNRKSSMAVLEGP